jgi:hypothetical protein
MFERLRRSIAVKISPELGDVAKKYDDMYNAVYDVKDWFEEVPEIQAACRWILGNVYLKNVDPSLPQEQVTKIVATSYNEYLKFPSLVKFREIITNEYKRKMK